ncbi:MAG: PH domain-containing protein, partial [Planctomycetota bacterium]|nr:PH domain-containing protein [Planctomycetota bacterium]
DKITDLALHEGPILRALGLTCLKVETAGQSSQGALLSLVGIRDSLAFRDAVLAQRDLIASSGAPPAPPVADDAPDVLSDIRDTLGRIEGLLRERS